MMENSFRDRAQASILRANEGPSLVRGLATIRPTIAPGAQCAWSLEKPLHQKSTTEKKKQQCESQYRYSGIASSLSDIRLQSATKGDAA